MDPIMRETLELAQKDKRTSRQIAHRAGVTHSVFYQWRNRGGGTISVVRAVLGALGYDLAIVRKDRGPVPGGASCNLKSRG